MLVKSYKRSRSESENCGAWQKQAWSFSRCSPHAFRLHYQSVFGSSLGSPALWRIRLTASLAVFLSPILRALLKCSLSIRINIASAGSKVPASDAKRSIAPRMMAIAPGVSPFFCLAAASANRFLTSAITGRAADPIVTSSSPRLSPSLINDSKPAESIATPKLFHLLRHPIKVSRVPR